MNSAALDSLGQSRAAKQRLTVTSPGGNRGRADRTGLQVSSAAATCLSRPAGDLGYTPHPAHPPPAAQPEEGARRRPREAPREPDAGRAHTLSSCAAALRVGRRGRGRRPRPLGQVQSMVVPWVRAQPWTPTSASTASAQGPAVRSRQRRPPQEVARTGTNGGTRRPTRKLFRRKP